MFAKLEKNEKKSRLDLSFPPLLLMGAALILSIALMMFCGWKILMLEQESRDIAQERLLLERDRDEFLTYGSDLPQLTDKHHTLDLQVRQFESRKVELAKNIQEMEDQREKLNLETHDLMGAVTELRSQKETLHKELAQTRAEMEKLLPERENIRKDVSLLQAQDKALAEQIAQKQKQEASLAANLEGMERTRIHNQQLLAKIAEDKAFYVDIQKTAQENANRFKELLANTLTLNADYGTRLEEMEKIRAKLSNGLENLESDLHNASQSLDAARKDRAAYLSMIDETGNYNKQFAALLEKIGESDKSFRNAISSLENMDKRFQATLLTEAAAINRMVQEESETKNQTGNVAEKLERSSNDMKGLISRLQEDAAHIRELLTGQRGELANVSNAARNVVAHIEKGQQSIESSIKAGASLTHSAVNLADQIDNLRSKLKTVDIHGTHMEKLLDGQSERLKDLTGLARELAAEIDESRRQGMLLQNIISTLNLRLAEHSMENAGMAQKIGHETPEEYEERERGKVRGAR